MSAPDPSRVPVIIGIGEVVDRPDDLPLAREPAILMADALREASRDAGGRDAGGRDWLARLDGLDLVNSISWPYGDIAGRVAALIGRTPRRLAHGPVGGETPVRFIHEAALRIARGESEVAAICGGEAEWSVQAARKAGLRLPWTAPDPGWTNPRVRDYLHPLALAHGLSQPVFVYPLYENACQAAWGQTPAEGQAESAALWAAFSAVAAENASAWLRRPVSVGEIETPSAGNRPIAWPYTKLTIANPVVNQGAAILLSSLAAARAAGLRDERLIHVWSGAAAQESRDWMSRDRFDHSPAQDAVLLGALARAGVDASDLDCVELYSCFPCVPKMARRTLALSPTIVPTVAGGLTFFGAPLNNYMTHAAAATVRRLRGGGERFGLLYGQGEFVTKHHALVLASHPAGRALEPATPSDQRDADRRRGPAPPIVETASGRARIETHTIVFDRDGRPTRGTVVLRDGRGCRTLARVLPEDASLDALTDASRSAVGLEGRLRTAADGLLEWTLP